MTTYFKSVVVVLMFLAGPGYSQNRSLTSTANFYAPLPFPSANLPNSQLTVEAWAKYVPLAVNPIPFGEIIRKGAGAQEPPFRMWSSLGDYRFSLKTTGSGEVLAFFGTLPDNQWHHLAATFDGSHLRTYLNGVQVFQVSAAGLIVADPGDLAISGGGSASNSHWTGSIDEVRIWGTVRTAAEIIEGMTRTYENDPGLVACWHLDGTFLDAVGTHHANPIGPIAFGDPVPQLALSIIAPTSTQIGGNVTFAIRGLEPFAPYILELSILGSNPGIVLADGRGFPLNPPLLYATFGTTYLSNFQNFFGFLDQNAEAFPVFALPFDSSIAGFILSSAFVTLDFNASSAISGISAAKTTTITQIPPEIFSVSPSFGATTGGTVVTITGNHFDPGASVLFDSVVAATVTVVNPTTMTCIAPPHATGPVVVKVMHPDGPFSTLESAFTYVPPLSISSISPLSSAVFGAPITLTGGPFVPGTTVTVAGIPVVPTSVTPTTVVFPNPNPGCNATVIVTDPTGRIGQTSFNQTPIITAVSPATGPAAGGTVVFVVGTNLAGAAVTIAGISPTVTLQNNSVIRFTAPPHAPGSVPVVVTSSAGCTAISMFTYL